MATSKTVLQKLDESLKILEIQDSDRIEDLDEALQHLNTHLKYLLFERDALQRERDFFFERLVNGTENNEM